MVGAFLCTQGVADEVAVSSNTEFRNQIFVEPPSLLLGGERAQSMAVSFFSGHLQRADIQNVPGTASVALIRSAFGQPFQTTSPLESFYCDPGTSVASWILSHFSESQLAKTESAETEWGLSANPDGDEYSNLLEFAYGLNPLSRDSTGLIRAHVEVVESSSYLFLTFRRRTGAEGVSVEAAFSSDQRNWNSGPGHSALVSSLMIEPGVEQVTFRDKVPLSPSVPRFARVEVSLNHVDAPVVQLPTLQVSGPPEMGGIVVIGRELGIQGSASVNNGCVIRYELVVDGKVVGASESGLFKYVPSTNGEIELSVKAVSHLGVVSESGRLRVKVAPDSDMDGIPDPIDPRPNDPNEPPIIHGLALTSANNFHTGGSVFLEGDFRDPDGDRMDVTLSSGPLKLAGPISSSKLSWMPGMEFSGLRILRLEVRDPWGARTQTDRGVYIFRSPPSP